MSFDDFESSDVIDLTRLDATHHHTGCDSSVQPVLKKLKTTKICGAATAFTRTGNFGFFKQ